MEVVSVSRVRAYPGNTFVVNAVISHNGEERRIETGISQTDDGEIVVALRDWLATNSVDVEPYVPPTTEELRIAMPPLTSRQLRLGLINNGIMPSQVQTALEAMPAGSDREKALVEWEYASTFDRLHPLIATVGVALGLADAQIDTMWTAAAAL